jgi:protein-L-isoaspartate(D-aspartate) O-methyltransferase
MHIDFTSKLHTATKRNYLERVADHDKAACAEVANKYGEDYWDGDRMYGYGGYRYDGRWLPIAEEMAKHYGLTPEHTVLDVGCGKGYLLYEFTRAVPGITVAGLDISQYAIDNAKEEVKPFLRQGNAVDLPYADGAFDLVVSLGAFHNLYNYDLRAALQEVERVSRAGKYVLVESYRDETEKVNLLYWQLTCRSFYTPKEWEWFFKESGYTGDYGCMFFQ